MNDFVAVHVFDSESHLEEVALCLHFGETFAALNELIEGLVRADLQQNVYAFSILEEVFEAHYILEFEGAVDLDL